MSTRICKCAYYVKGKEHSAGTGDGVDENEPYEVAAVFETLRLQKTAIRSVFLIFSGMEHGTQSGYSFKYQAKSYQSRAFFASEGCDISQ